MENNEKLGFAALDEVGVKEDSKNLAMRPVENMAILKHDARDGSVKVMLSNPDDEPDEVIAKELEFVPTLVFSYVGGAVKKENLRVASSLTSNNFFDVYKYSGDSSESLGIMKSNAAYDLTNGITSRLDRIFGVLRSVDNKNPMTIPEIAEHFEGEKIVPCFIDLKYSKSKWLQAQAGSRNWSKAIKQKFVTISGGKKGLSYETPEGKSYHPKFAITENQKSLMNLAEIAQDHIDACVAFAKEVEEHDRFIKELYLHGLTMAGAVDYLRDLDVYDVDSLNSYFEEQKTDWSALATAITQSVQQKVQLQKQSMDNAVKKIEKVTNQKSFSDVGTQDVMDAINDQGGTNDQDIKITDEGLPF